MVTTAHKPVLASVGTPFVIAELGEPRRTVTRQSRIGAFRAAAARFTAIGTRFALHSMCGSTAMRPGCATRMFAPLAGVLEDPATGSANAALAALLTSLAPGENVDLTYDIAQGIEMGRPSRIVATARKTAEGPVSATVAGTCVPVLRGSLEL